MNHCLPRLPSGGASSGDGPLPFPLTQKCSHCGTRSNASASHCPSCGAPLP